MAYGLDKQPGENFVIVFDLGGSALDVSLLSVYDGVRLQVRHYLIQWHSALNYRLLDI